MFEGHRALPHPNSRISRRVDPEITDADGQVASRTAFPQAGTGDRIPRLSMLNFGSKGSIYENNGAINGREHNAPHKTDPIRRRGEELRKHVCALAVTGIAHPSLLCARSAQHAPTSIRIHAGFTLTQPTQIHTQDSGTPGFQPSPSTGTTIPIP